MVQMENSISEAVHMEHTFLLSSTSTSDQFIKMSSKDNPTQGMSTALSSSICKVFGDIDDTEFDQLRHALKIATNK